MPSTYEPIATQTLGSDVSSVTFTSIPQTYTDLMLVFAARSAVSLGSDFLFCQPNNDTGTTKSNTNLNGNGSTATSFRTSNDAYMSIGVIAGATATANVYGASIAHFMNYSNTTTNKTVISRGSQADSVVYPVSASVGLWRSTSAITSLYLYAGGLQNIKAGSTFTLYGIKAA
jgi:hypothetical protein